MTPESLETCLSHLMKADAILMENEGDLIHAALLSAVIDGIRQSYGVPAESGALRN